jgi:ABC-2 type transport system permease protein
MSKSWAMAFKDLRLLLRDKVGFFFTFFFPVLYAIFFGSIIGGGGAQSEIRIAVVDEDRTAESASFAAELDDAPELVVTHASRAEAVDLVRRGRCVAYVVLPEGFAQTRRNPFWGRPTNLELGIDPARRAESGMLQGILNKHLFEKLGDLFANPESMREQIQDSLAAVRDAGDMDPLARTTLLSFLPALDRFLEKVPEFNNTDSGEEEELQGFQPVKIQITDVARKRVGPKNSFEISFPQGIIWGIIGCSAGFGIAMVSERRSGTLVRLRMSPIGRTHILAAKGAACFVTTLSVTVMLLAIGMLGFGVRPGSVGLLGLAIVSVAVSFVGIMILLSVLGRTEQAAAGIGWAIMIVMAMLGGGMIPLFIMPPFMQTLSNISPVKWSILALEGAIWRGFTLGEMIAPCTILVATGVACFAAGARAFRWTEQG